MPRLKEEFYKSVGQNKTLKYLNLGVDACRVSQHSNLAKAIAMNKKSKGSLEAVVLENWFLSYSQLVQFLAALKISDQDSENWYGDKNAAKDMKKE